MPSRPRLLAYAALIVLSIAAFIAITLRLRLDPNVSALLPDSGNAAAMKRYVRGFGGGDLGVVMIQGDSPEDNARIAAKLAEDLRARPSVEQAADRVDTSHTLDPMLARAGGSPRRSPPRACAAVSRRRARCSSRRAPRR